MKIGSLYKLIDNNDWPIWSYDSFLIHTKTGKAINDYYYLSNIDQEHNCFLFLEMQTGKFNNGYAYQIYVFLYDNKKVALFPTYFSFEEIQC